MSWSDPEPAFHILRPRTGEEVNPSIVSLNATSTSTVEDPDGTGATTLRIYNVTSGDINNAVDALPSAIASAYEFTVPDIGCPEGLTLDVEDPWIAYMDSHVINGEEAFVLQAYRSPLRSTCIPRYRFIWDYTYIRQLYGYAAQVAASQHTAFHYGGVNVTRLPDGRWLMLMHRARITIGGRYLVGMDRFREFVDDPRVFLGANTRADGSVIDIVGYIAEDATFTRGISGPFWFVDSKNALPVGELPTFTGAYGTVGARLWLGVPSAVIVDDNIYIYYVFEISRFFYDPLSEDNGGDLEQNDYTNGLGEFRQGIGVKVVAYDDLLATETRRYSTISYLYQEAHWEEAQDWGFDPVVPGTLLGRVQISVTEPSGSTALFEDVWVTPYLAALGTTFAFLDPAAYLCDDGTISLVFVSDMRGTPLQAEREAQVRDAGQGWDGPGVWRARGTGGGTFGRDFEIEVDWDTGLDGSRTMVGSDDQIIRVEATVEGDEDDPRGTTEPGYGQGPFQNPDVTLLADGRLRVQCSGQIDEVPTNALVFGTAGSACPSAAAASPAVYDPHRRPPRAGERPVPWVVMPERGEHTWIGR